MGERGIVGEFWVVCGRQLGGFGNSATAKAIRQRQRTTMPKYTHTLPSLTRPFLRKQESILTMCRQRRRQFRRRCRPVKNRFLPTQEWSTGGRGIVGDFWHYAGDNLAIWRWRILWIRRWRICQFGGDFGGARQQYF